MAAPQRQGIDNCVVGTVIYVIVAMMLFLALLSGLESAKSAAPAWPPPGQPQLPVGETALYTIALLFSGAILHSASTPFARDGNRARALVVAIGYRTATARRPLLISIMLGIFFVACQGATWFALLRAGFTFTSSRHGSFFHLIVGIHAFHAVAALCFLGYAYWRLRSGQLTPSLFRACQIYWYFVVGAWPVLYLQVYL